MNTLQIVDVFEPYYAGKRNPAVPVAVTEIRKEISKPPKALALPRKAAGKRSFKVAAKK